MNISKKSKLKKRVLPSLQDTYKSYLKFLKPYTERKQEQKDSDKFFQVLLKNPGIDLQNKLLEKNNICNRWLFEIFLDTYMKDRYPYLKNYYILFDLGFIDQIEAVAKIILCSIILKTFMKSDKINQLTTKCPYQYNLLFYTCRTPKLNGKDELITYELKDNKYIIIIYNNVFWLIEADLDYEHLCEQINYIISMNLSSKTEEYIGILTSDNRNDWFRFRKIFINVSNNNKDFLYYVEKCMIIFSLEDCKLDNIGKINNLCLSAELSNKYFDRIIQIIVFKDGYVAMNADRIIDISILVEFGKFIRHFTINTDLVSEKPVMNYFENFSNKPVKLNYDLNEEIKLKILQTYSKKIIELENNYLIFSEYGKVVLQRKGLPINGFIQLAIISAYYRVSGSIVPTMQYVSGRNFLYGTSEILRTTTKESANFAIALSEMKVPRDLKIKLGYDCLKTYNSNYNDVNNGKSIDVHFKGLLSVINDDENKPELFKSKLFEDSTKWVIETYPFNNDFIKSAGIRPSYKDGISICFIVRKDHIQFNFFHYGNNKTIEILNQNLIDVLREMKDLFIEKEREYLRPKF